MAISRQSIKNDNMENNSNAEHIIKHIEWYFRAERGPTCSNVF